MLDELVQKGLEIHLIKENVILSRDSRSSEKFVHGIKVLMAKNYIDNLAEETRKGLTEKAAQGMWPSQAPRGYRNIVRDDRTKVMVPDPIMGPIIANLFDWFSSGLHSVDDAARKARADGLRFRKRSTFGPKVHYPSDPAQSALHGRVLVGRQAVQGEVRVANHARIVRSRTACP